MESDQVVYIFVYFVCFVAKDSPGHRANILSPSFTQIGIGVADGGPYGKILTQQFIG